LKQWLKVVCIKLYFFQKIAFKYSKKIKISKYNYHLTYQYFSNQCQKFQTKPNSLSLSLSHTHTPTHTHTHAYSTHTLTHSLTHSHSLSLAYALKNSTFQDVARNGDECWVILAPPVKKKPHASKSMLREPPFSLPPDPHIAHSISEASKESEAVTQFQFLVDLPQNIFFQRNLSTTFNDLCFVCSCHPEVTEYSRHLTTSVTKCHTSAFSD